MTAGAIMIALPDSQMWERVIAKRVIRGSELIFRTLDGNEYTGWVTGLDEEWVQITDRNLKMWAFQRLNIAATGETGAKFHEVDWTDEQKKKFEQFSNRFTEACRKALGDTGDSAFHRVPIHT